MKTIDKKYEELCEILGEYMKSGKDSEIIKRFSEQLSLTMIEQIGSVPKVLAPFVASVLENIAGILTTDKEARDVKEAFSLVFGNRFGMVRVPNSVLERLKNESEK